MLTDDMLRQAATESNAAFIQAVERDYDGNRQYIPSLRFEKKMKRLTRRAKHPNLYRSTQRVASVVLVLLLAGSAWLTVDVQARETFFGWVKELYEEFYVYRLTGDATTKDAESTYALGWIPDGYAELFTDTTDGTTTTIYANENGQMLTFSYTSNTEDVDWFVDGTNVERHEIVIGTSEGDFLLSTDDQIASTIVWAQADNAVFYLSGFLDEDILLQIANSVVEKSADQL